MDKRKRLALVLLVLFTAIMIFTPAQLDYADMPWKKNWVPYMGLAGNILVSGLPPASARPLPLKSQIENSKYLFNRKQAHPQPTGTNWWNYRVCIGAVS